MSSHTSVTKTLAHANIRTCIGIHIGMIDIKGAKVQEVSWQI